MTKRAPLAAVVLGALTILSGVLIASALRALHPVSCCDSEGYYELSQALVDRRPSALAGNIRTYGYPAFLAAISFGKPLEPAALHAAAAAAQGALLGAAAVLAYGLARSLSASKRVSAFVAATVLCNPVLWARASELLTDLASAVLLFAAFLPAIWGDPSRSPVQRAFVSVLAASAAAAVRPSHVLFLAVAVGGWLVYVLRSAPPRRRAPAAAGVLLAALLPLAPQILLNNRFLGTMKPFVMSSQYGHQTSWGMRMLKNATWLKAGEFPYLVYPNPFWNETWRSPAQFFRESPPGYAATLGLHAFAVLDQEALFTYITDRKPWYREAVMLANFAWLFAALAGGAAAVVKRGPCRSDAALRRAGLASLLLCSLVVAFYAPTLVESRFSTPVYLLGVPLIVIAARLAGDLYARRAWARIAGLAFGGLLFAAAAFALSGWIDRHAVVQVTPPQKWNPAVAR